jgi:phosphoribosylanthranilate isomerase
VFDWSLITDLVRERRVVLAGGLRPDNVHAAVAQVNPYGVDTASGVEVAPGIKDEALLRQFIAQATTAGVAPQLRSVTRS